MKWWLAANNDLIALLNALTGYIVAGVRHIILNLTLPFAQGITHRLAGEIVEPPRVEFASGEKRAYGDFWLLQNPP